MGNAACVQYDWMLSISVSSSVIFQDLATSKKSEKRGDSFDLSSTAHAQYLFDIAG